MNDHDEKWRGMTMEQRKADARPEVLQMAREVCAIVDVEEDSGLFNRVLISLSDDVEDWLGSAPRCPLCGNAQMYCVECEVTP